MAKMFYTLDEAASKLGVAPDDVRGLIDSGQLQEFRDRDQVMLKVDQVDLLAGGDEKGSMIPLADSGELESIGLSSSGTGSMFTSENPMEATGISIFDPEAGDNADPAAQTQVSNSPLGFAGFDGGSSGSGLAGLALESDDSSLGANLLEDVYSGGGTNAGVASAGGSMSGSGALSESAVAQPTGDLFESTGAEAEYAAPVAMAFTPEVYDGPGSGIVAGLAVGTVLVLLVAAVVLLMAITGGSSVLAWASSMTVIYAVAGGGLLAMLLGAGLGFVLLRKS